MGCATTTVKNRLTRKATPSGLSLRGTLSPLVIGGSHDGTQLPCSIAEDSPRSILTAERKTLAHERELGVGSCRRLKAAPGLLQHLGTSRAVCSDEEVASRRAGHSN